MVWNTHTVFNQPKPLGNSNLFLSDTPLHEAIQREQAGWDAEVLASLGQQLGTQESLELGRLANVNPPELLRYDATGQRLDDVRFHPAWHILMQGLIANRVHNLPWQEDARIGSFVARAARFVLHAQVEAGTLCPVTMTFGAIPLLQRSLPAEFQTWLTPLLSDRYDAHLLPGGQKRGLLIGMGMTEKQGGSDVLSNTTTATPLAARAGAAVGRRSGIETNQAGVFIAVSRRASLAAQHLIQRQHHQIVAFVIHQYLTGMAQDFFHGFDIQTLAGNLRCGLVFRQQLGKACNLTLSFQDGTVFIRFGIFQQTLCLTVRTWLNFVGVSFCFTDVLLLVFTCGNRIIKCGFHFFRRTSSLEVNVQQRDTHVVRTNCLFQYALSIATYDSTAFGQDLVHGVLADNATQGAVSRLTQAIVGIRYAEQIRFRVSHAILYVHFYTYHVLIRSQHHA